LKYITDMCNKLPELESARLKYDKKNTCQTLHCLLPLNVSICLQDVGYPTFRKHHKSYGATRIKPNFPFLFPRN